MGKRQRNKRKKSDNSDHSANDESVCKAGRFASTPEKVCVSSVLKEANSVLFDCENDANDSVLQNIGDLFCQVTEAGDKMPTTGNTDVNNGEGSGGPISNSELLIYLKRIDGRMGNMEKKLDKLDELEKKVSNFEREINKIWTCMQDHNKKNSERLTVVEEKVESSDFNLGLVNDKLVTLEKENVSLKEDLTYLQSQSMRNNLVFANIEEAPSGVQENTEQKLREFLESKMKLAKEQVDRMAFERVHRMGQKVPGSNRKIVAKFTLFKERELVRKQWKTLDNTPYYVHEQFPKEVVAKRRQLIPKMKEAKRSGKNAWIAYDTLYIDGKAQRENQK